MSVRWTVFRTATLRSGRPRGRHRIPATRGRQLPEPDAETASPRLLAESGLHRHQPDHLRSALALWLAAKADPGNDRGPFRCSGSASYGKIIAFTKLFWANRGNHNENTAQKFLPDFTFDELKEAGLAALRHGARGFTEASFLKELDELKPSLFDPDFEPLVTAKSPEGGLDIIQASANNFYFGVTLADLANFTEHYPLNSRLAKVDGRLVEQVYRAGRPNGKIPPGLYAEYLAEANSYLEKAAAVADPAQARVIRDLIRFYQTGDPKDWIHFGIDWVQNNAPVDFANGFIEVYRDARGAKGTSQSFVTITDNRLNSLMLKIAGNAQYFEDRAPWKPEYRKQGVKPPLAKAVETLIETGDFHVTTIGDNLPNENEVHEKYGSKSFLFTGSSRALNSAGGTRALEEFAASPEEIALGKKYGEEAEDLITALHEIIGHGSGKLNPKLTHDPAYYLKEYYSTLEEARADLMALWNVWDPKLKELGLISNPDVGQGDVLCLRANHPHPASPHPARRYHRGGSRARSPAHRQLYPRPDRRHRRGKPQWQNVSGAARFRKNAPGSRPVAGRVDAHQGGRRLRRQSRP